MTNPMSERDEFGGHTQREAMEIMGMPIPAPTPQARPVIPAEAVEAALSALLPGSDLDSLRGGFWWGNVEIILEAAAPYMLSHEREQTRLAHLDAMVNRETKHAELAEAFAYGWREGKGIPTPVNVDTQELLHHEAQQPTWNFYKDGIDDE